jgi:heterodisulfide reductase subunit D
MQEVHYWSGCTFRARYPEDVDAHIDLLRALGYEVKRIDREGCCGYPMILAGEMETAKSIAKRTAEEFREVKLLTTECPGCFRVFRDEYPKMGMKIPEVRHLTQILIRHLDRIVVPTKEVVTYHDPCDLGRLGGDYQSPRDVLGRVAEIIEPLATREMANCCGAGGLMLNLAPELSMRIGEARIEGDIEPTGAKKLITACPSCLFNLTAAAARREGADGGLQVWDLASYIYRRLKEND